MSCIRASRPSAGSDKADVVLPWLLALYTRGADVLTATHRLPSFITESCTYFPDTHLALENLFWLPRLPAPVRPMAAAIRTGEAAAGNACMAALFVTLTTRIYFFAHIFSSIG